MGLVIDLRRLQVFLAVAETGSFTAAASRLYLSQPGVSQQIGLLERELGEALFSRTSRGVRLNEAGIFLRDRARELLSQALALERDFHAHHDGFTRVVIGSFPTAGVELLPQAFRQLMGEWPKLRLRMKQLDSIDPLSLLREQEADLVLVFEYDIAPRPVDRTFVHVELADDPICALLPVGHPLADQETVSLAALADEHWILRRHRPPYEHIHEQMFRRAGFDPQVAFWTDDYQSLQGLVAAHVGVGLAPSLSITQHRSDIVVRPLGTPLFTRRVSLVTSAEFRSRPIAAAFIDALRVAAQKQVLPEISST